MTFKPGDNVRRKPRNTYATVASVFEDGTAFVDDSGITHIAENWEPLPAKPEDVREELVEMLYAWFKGYLPRSRAGEIADAILAKFPKILEGT